MIHLLHNRSSVWLSTWCCGLRCIVHVILVWPNVSGVCPADDSITILFGGDTSYGESYQESYAEAGEENVVASRGYDYSIANLRHLLAASDFNILNLETPLTHVREKPFVGKGYYHYSHPEIATRAMKQYGVHAVSLANNHTLDYGEQALHETCEALENYGIKAFGAGESLSSASEPLTRKFSLGESQFELVVFGLFEYRKNYDQEYHFYAEEDRPGTCPIDLKKLAEDIQSVRKRIPHAYIVVFPHWGENYVWRSDKQKELGRGMINAGANLVVGHGAHCLQEFEQYREGWIFYSIGNFLFNSRGRYAKLDAPPYSMPMQLVVSNDGGQVAMKVRLYPILSDNTQTNFQPRFVTELGFEIVRSLLRERCDSVEFDRQVKSNSNDIGRYLEIRIQ